VNQEKEEKKKKRRRNNETQKDEVNEGRRLAEKG